LATVNFWLYYVAAAATAIAGMCHLMLGPNMLGFNMNQGILFVVGGIAQVFWIIPMIRRWGKIWYAVGIVGTAVFLALFFITRVPGNPITGRGGGMNTISIIVEVFQAIFIALAAAIIVYESRRKRIVDDKPVGEKTTGGGKASIAILSGVVVVLILSAVFVLPMALPRPMGGPPGGAGGPGGGPP
jgi:hypothetical protein